MDRLDNTEAWRQIPPEEKLALLSRAHGSGIMTCAITIILSCTLAVGLRTPWLMWGSFIISPLLFQFAAGKAWRDLRPKVMLEYLAARAAARRYAYLANAKDLGVNLILRARSELLYDKEHIQDELEAIITNQKQTEVWLALFRDAVVMMEEKVGGAECICGAVVSEKMKLEGKSSDNSGDYSNNRELYLTLPAERGRPSKRFKLTSDFPAALIVFEKKLNAAITEASAEKKSPASSSYDEDSELLGLSDE